MPHREHHKSTQTYPSSSHPTQLGCGCSRSLQRWTDGAAFHIEPAPSERRLNAERLQNQARPNDFGVPVACGPEQPLEGFDAFPGSWRAAADDGCGLDLPVAGSPSDLDAPALLISVIRESPDPVVVYAAGPQTNLAAALRSDPSLAGNISAVFMTGGAIATGSAVARNPDADWLGATSTRTPAPTSSQHSSSPNPGPT